jgi:ribonuclease BN (tRNA processing enzyme)
MPGFSFTILGSSSGKPHPTRATAGYVLEAPSGLTVIDCGGGTVGSFLRCGFDPTRIERFIISHTHPDHVCELPLFVQMVHLAQRTTPVSIHVPEEFLDPLNAMLPAMYVIPARLPFALATTGFMPGGILRTPITVIAIPNTHLEKYADDITNAELPNEMMCNSLSIEAGEKRLLYSADLGSFDDIEPYLENHHVCIIESTHVDIAMLLAYAKSSPGTRIILTHLGSDDEIAALAKRVEGVKNVELAFDGMKIEW